MSNTRGNEILKKLDEFIRKYYKNQLIRGSFYTFGLGLVFYLTATSIEYFGELNITARTILFYSWVISSVLIISKYIVIPITKLSKLGKIISHEQAATIIGLHFVNVKDKLLNFLQLSTSKADIHSIDLWQASINQKINELKPVPFSAAVNLTENRKYIKFVFIPVATLLILLFAAPSILTEGTKRLVNYNTFYKKQAPFSFVIQNKDLQALQQEDFILNVKIEGKETPNEVYINFDGNKVKLEKENAITFKYTFKNLQEALIFQLSANDVFSDEYELKAIPKPTLVDFKVLLSFPAYLQRKNETVNNTGDFIIPQGTKVNWQFNTRNAEFVRITFSDTILFIQPASENKFTFSKNCTKSGYYTIRVGNQIISTNDSLYYSINVVPDLYPEIQVNEQKDSIQTKNIYFSGTLKDDYGFSKMNFSYTNYTTDSLGKSTEKKKQISVPINKTQPAQAFYHYFDLNRLEIKPGDKIEYFFEVWDNDGVNGAKSTKSSVMIFKAPTLEEVNKEVNKNSQEIEQSLEAALKAAKELQKQISEISRQVQEKKQLGWEEKKKLEDLVLKQLELQKKVENIKKENQQNNELKNELNKQNESLLEKQKQLEKLMENIMTPEMKKMFDELQKMMDKMMDKNKIKEQLEKMKYSDKDIEKELDRNLELFKQMEVEQRLDKAIQKLSEIKKEEEKLAEKSEDKKMSSQEMQDKKEELNKKLNLLKKQLEEALKNKEEKKIENVKEDIKKTEKEKNDLAKDANEPKTDSKELQKKQEENSEKFNELKKELKELEQKNKELENPNPIPSTNEKEKEVSQEQKKSEEQLSKDDKKGAAKSQKGAAQKMSEMEAQMEQAQQKMQEEQGGEDMAAMRQLLENLLNLSFAQEDLIKQAQKIKVTDPNYTKIAQQQQKLKDDAKMVEDSLLAISKRQPKVSADVNREISNIEMNMGKSISWLEERSTEEASNRMQNIMTSLNNLALMLNESLEQMQQAAAEKKSGKPGSGSCNKPGGSGQKPSMGGIKKMQEALNKQMQQMKQAMEKGKNPNGKKPGNNQGLGGEGGTMPTSEQFAKIAAQQEALRKMMQNAMNNIKDGGKNPGGDMASKMEETENELVNKVITQETLNRQRDILTRLLESEKAELEREIDEKRESNEAKNEKRSNLNLFLEYKKLKEQEFELLKTVPPSLTPFYKQKVSNYFNNNKN